MVYTIKNDFLSVSISDMGAEIVSVIHKGVERVWQNENGAWSGHSPVLFPVCGNCAVVIGGKDYGMSFHGFARTSVFECENIKNDEITFCLRYNNHTFAFYPFKFEFRITYKVIDDTVVITNVIKNVGTVTMPFALGRHDSFILSKPLEKYKLCFPLDEEFLSQQCDESRRLINLYYDFGSGKELIFPSDYLTDGQSIIFEGINSDHLFLKTIDNRPIARFFYGRVNNLLFWRPNASQLICIEPWTALPDRADEFNVDFLQKKRLIKLNESQSKQIDFTIKYY